MADQNIRKVGIKKSQQTAFVQNPIKYQVSALTNLGNTDSIRNQSVTYSSYQRPILINDGASAVGFTYNTSGAEFT